LIDEHGENHGVVTIGDALTLARDAGLDLLELSPNANPPVCKILDHGKFKYEEQKRKNEIKFRPNIDDHDYGVKMRSMVKFLEEGDKVKVTLRFRGRELRHQELGTAILERVKSDTLELAKVEQFPSMEGRQMVMVLAPR
jgi:translation initiation factor IF-3